MILGLNIEFVFQKSRLDPKSNTLVRFSGKTRIFSFAPLQKFKREFHKTNEFVLVSESLIFHFYNSLANDSKTDLKI
ncbi:hypothetical protein QMM42_10580 [Leptospira santarosai]|uniref:hypothetical protein n=1 Tax=Leptospira santarosai TaxID=28183 RepID=UPI0024AEF9CC|nr:hypothetical protein [Leptospira santarosai]MDI7186644.1 hypothetical protein [Leptospira santarosai]MDI7200425.1 hypothetical protein [Leptospira santarosai]